MICCLLLLLTTFFYIIQSAFAKFRIFLCVIYCNFIALPLFLIAMYIYTDGEVKKSHFNDDAVNNRKFFVAVLSNLFGMQTKHR